MFSRIQILGIVLLVMALAGCSGEPAAANDPAQQTDLQTVADGSDQQQQAQPTSADTGSTSQDNTELVARVNDVPQGELDLVMAETAEIRSDPENRSRSHGRWCTAGYVLELAKIIDARRARDLSN